MNKIYIIHHSADLDGFFSGAITYLYHLDRLNMKEEDIICIPYNYQPQIMIKDEISGKRIDFFDVPQNNDKVFFVDVSWTKDKESIQKLIDRGVYIELIDHHESSINWYKENFNNIVEMKYSKNSSDLTIWKDNHPESAAMLCWNKFFSDSDEPNKALKYASDYDIWYKPNIDIWENETLAFQLGFRTLGYNMFNISGHIDTLRNYLYDIYNIDDIINDGIAIIKYQKSRAKMVLKQNGRFVDIKIGERTYKGYIGSDYCNNSTLFEWGLGADSEEYKGVELFIKAIPVAGSNEAYISFISNRDDISAADIAEVYGGGGHKSIAGCHVFLNMINFKDPNTGKIVKHELIMKEYDGSCDPCIIALDANNDVSNIYRLQMIS